MHNLNIAIFNAINGGAGYYHYLDTFLLFLTSYLAYGVSIVIGLYTMVWLPLRNSNERVGWRRFHQGVELAFATGLTYLVVKFLKAYTASPRPFLVLENVHALAPYESGYSFPSGHSSMTMAVATIVYFYHKRLGVLLYLFAGVVGVSRIYVGVHYPIDVLTGFILGFIIPHIVHFIVNKKTA